MSSYTFNTGEFPSAVNMDLKLYYCGSAHCTPNHTVGPAVKDHYKFHYVHSGTGIFQAAGKTYTLTAGQGFVICPDILSFYKADEADPWSYSWVAFNGLHAELYLKRAQLSVDKPIFSCDPEQNASIEGCFASMFEAAKHSRSRDMKLLGQLYYFLAIIIDASGSTYIYETSEDIKAHYVKTAMDYIETNYSNTVSIENLAEKLNLNRKYMSKLFKDAVGLTPQEYLINYRMDKASEMMRNTSLTISEISQSVGYSDQMLFSRMFKKTLGQSPTQHRESLLHKRHDAAIGR